jgi:hypothetical protein
VDDVFSSRRWTSEESGIILRRKCFRGLDRAIEVSNWNRW